MESAPQQLIEFDIRGQICPATLLIALREMNRHSTALNTGAAKLVFKTDNRDATGTIPSAAHNMGYKCDVVKVESYYVISISN